MKKKSETKEKPNDNDNNKTNQSHSTFSLINDNGSIFNTFAITNNNFEFDSEDYFLTGGISSFFDNIDTNNNNSNSNDDNDVNNRKSGNSSPKKKRKKSFKKKNIPLTADGKDFRVLMDYKFEKNHKRVPKPVVKLLFNSVCDELNLPKMERKYERAINMFFNDYAHLKVEIINAMSKYIENHPQTRQLIENMIQKSNSKKSINH